MNAFQASYLAGFLDGDGSIHFQMVRQKEYRFGFYIRSTLSLSQSTTARTGLEVLRDLIGGGYLRDRGTGMSDLVITSRPLLGQVLRSVEPYVVFKREHVRRALELLPRLDRLRDPVVFLQIAHEVDSFATLNYSKTKRVFAADVERYLRSKGVLCPCNDFPGIAHREDGVSTTSNTDAVTRQPLERG